ncbi:hypothetical protein BvCmsNSNP030_5103 (plasmid) [Escherichia coli]|nr:hypothetical protein BvCmsNSNP030_4962 [Escherichia coli]BCM50032.1 hypothetical protein BvCmsNSNP030_5103 [Escherichia coli]
MVYRLAYMKKSGNTLSRCPDFVIHYSLRNDKDLTDKYAVILEVYQNICSNQQFDLNGLEQMVKSRLFYMLLSRRGPERSFFCPGSAR